MTGLVISIVALVAGITGILAAAKSFIVLILIVRVYYHGTKNSFFFNNHIFVLSVCRYHGGLNGPQHCGGGQDREKLGDLALQVLLAEKQ